MTGCLELLIVSLESCATGAASTAPRTTNDLTQQGPRSYLTAVSMYIYLINPFLQAASTPLSPLTFQCEFIKLRIDTLQALSQLICTCNSLKTSPPPAIATSIALTSGNDLQRCGRIAMQVDAVFPDAMGHCVNV